MPRRRKSRFRALLVLGGLLTIGLFIANQTIPLPPAVAEALPAVAGQPPISQDGQVTAPKEIVPNQTVSSKVPAKYRDWVKLAGSQCPEITPALISAQIEQESGWDSQAQAYNPPERGGPAYGMSQFIASTWKTWGRDYDKDGSNHLPYAKGTNNGPFDPEDAIMAQSKLMCSNITWAKKMVQAPTSASDWARGEILDLALAAYNCGNACVSSNRFGNHGVPKSGQPFNYVRLIKILVKKYS